MKSLKFMSSWLLALPLLFGSGGVLAGIGASATPNFPSDALVDEMGIQVSLQLKAEGDVNNLVVQGEQAFITMSCATNIDPWNCAGADVDLGVFMIEDTTAVLGGSSDPDEICGDGLAGSEEFDFSTEDANGEVTITPTDGNFPTFNPGDLCTVNFTVKVLKEPKASALPAGTTVQGGQVFLDAAGELPAQGSGADNTNITACSVQVDKQVSCDGGVTWTTDTGYADGTTDSCSALDDEMVQVRYRARNPESNCPLTNCSYEESNPVFGDPGGSFSLGNGAESVFTTSSQQVCKTAFPNDGREPPNEPNTVKVTCDTPTPGVKVDDEDTATFACLSVELLVDRNVDCDGVNGDDPADMQLTMDDGDTQLGCTAVDGDPVNWGYQACNNGEAPLYNCRLTDSNTDVSIPINIPGELASCSGTPATPSPTEGPINCSTALEADELANGKVTLECCTTNDPLDSCARIEEVFDWSKVTCQTPSELEIVKECVDSETDGTDDGTKVTVSATDDDLGFTNCSVTDNIYRDNPDCTLDGGDPSLPVGTADPVTLSNATYDLAPNGEEISEGLFNPPLEEDACNQASVTCDDYAGNQVTEYAAPVICDVQGDGCITRTGGFWGNRPETTVNYLDVEVCGMTLNSVEAYDENETPDGDLSATEAICSVGRDGKILGQQVTQLIRQCTVAQLNLAVTAEEEGGCDVQDELNIAACCGAAQDEGNLCSAEDAASALSVSACIDLLDEFNNDPDTLTSDVFAGIGAAQPGECKDSRNNGYHPGDPDFEAPAKPGKGKKK